MVLIIGSSFINPAVEIIIVQRIINTRDGIKSFFEGMGSLTALKDNFQVMCPTKKNKTYGIPKVNKSKDK